MKLLTHIPSWLRNKYFVATTLFVLVMLFLDKNDVFTQLQRRKDLHNLEKSKAWYSTQLNSERKEYEALKNNPATIEKYAREKVLMKRDNEDLFLVPEKYESPKN